MIWKDVVGYEGLYKISEKGDVLSLPRLVNANKKGQRMTEKRILKQQLNHKGYPLVSLSHINDGKNNKMFSVHRLVAKAFIPNPNNLPQVNHIDGNKQNNHYTNLEWCDNSYNQIHAYRIGLNKSNPNSGRPSKPVLKMNKVTHEVLEEFSSASEAARHHYTSEGNVAAYCRGKGKSNSHNLKGFYWRYKEDYEKELH